MSSFAIENGLIVLNNGSFSYTIQANPSADRVYTLPDTTDTGVSLNDTQTITNKTLIDPTNTIRASQLATISGDVVLTSSQPPIIGQVLTALSSTSAAWRSPGSVSSTFEYSSDNTSTSSTSTTYTNKLVHTTSSLTTGDYLVYYCCEVSQSSTNGSCQVQFDVNGTVSNDTIFYPQNAAMWQSQSGFYKATLSGVVNLTIRFRRSVSTGTASIRNARIFLQKT